MKKIKPLYFWIILIITNSVLFTICAKNDSSSLTFGIAFFILVFVGLYTLGSLLFVFFNLIGILIKKTGILESKIYKRLSNFLKISIETIAKIIITGLTVVAILTFIILIFVGAGWFIASASATSIIIVLLILILLK